MGDPVLVVMGPAGSGKSTLGVALAAELDLPFLEGDALYSAESVAKMRAGHPLDDADRAPWLARNRGWIDARLEAGEGGVVACSALRRAYRDVLVSGHPDRVRLVALEATPALLAARVAARTGHFLPASLLDSQVATFEPPGDEERPIRISAEWPVGRAVSEVLRGLGLERPAASG
ncbi:MAG TPA: gluconokinase, GntK/IdnK-type [Myxococcaceae bacterium]|jgi:gluconokinase